MADHVRLTKLQRAALLDAVPSPLRRERFGWTNKAGTSRHSFQTVHSLCERGLLVVDLTPGPSRGKKAFLTLDGEELLEARHG